MTASSAMVASLLDFSINLWATDIDCNVLPAEMDRITLDYLGLNTTTLPANTPPLHKITHSLQLIHSHPRILGNLKVHHSLFFDWDHLQSNTGIISAP